MHEKLEINRTKIKGGCQSVRKAVTHNSKSDLRPLVAHVGNNQILGGIGTFFFVNAGMVWSKQVSVSAVQKQAL